MTMSKLVGIPIFTTLLSLLAEKQPNTAQNESYIGVIKVKLLSHPLLLVTQVLNGREMLNFLWYISAYLMIICSGFISSKCIRVKTVRG